MSKSGNLSNTKRRGQELRKYKMDRKCHFFSASYTEFKGDTNTLTYTVDGKEKTVKLSQEAADNYWKYFRNCTNGYALDYLVEHDFKLNEGTYRVLKLSTRTSTPEEAKATAADIKALFTKLLGVCAPSYHESVLKVWKVINEKILKLSDNKNSICSKISIIKDIFFPSVEGIDSLDDTINGKQAKVYVSNYTNNQFKVFIDSDYSKDKLIKYTDEKTTDYYAAIICKKMYDDSKTFPITGQIINIVESFLNKGGKKNTANSVFFPVSIDSFFKIDVFKVYGLNTADIKKIYSEKNNEMITKNYKLWSPSMIIGWYYPITEAFKNTSLTVDELYDSVETAASAYGYTNADTKALSTCIFYLFNTIPKPEDVEFNYLTQGDNDELIEALLQINDRVHLDRKFYAPLRFCFAGNFTFDLTDNMPLFNEEVTPEAWKFLHDKIDDDEEFDYIVQLLKMKDPKKIKKQNETQAVIEMPHDIEDFSDKEDEVDEEPKEEKPNTYGVNISKFSEDDQKAILNAINMNKADRQKFNKKHTGDNLYKAVQEILRAKDKQNTDRAKREKEAEAYELDMGDKLGKKEGISSRKLKKLGLKNWQVKKIKKIINNRVNETINEALKDKPKKASIAKGGVTENDTLNEIKEMLKLLIGEDKTQQVERPTTIALTQQPKAPNVKYNRPITDKSFNPSDIVEQRNKLKPVKHIEKPVNVEHNLKYEIEHFDPNKLNKTLKGLNKIIKKGELTQDKQKALKILKRIHLNPVTANLIKIVGTGANPKTYKGGVFSDLLSFIPGGSAAFNIAKSVYNVAKPLINKAVDKYEEAYAKSKGNCRKNGYMNSKQLKKYLVNNQKPKLEELAKVLK